MYMNFKDFLSLVPTPTTSLSESRAQELSWWYGYEYIFGWILRLNAKKVIDREKKLTKLHEYFLLGESRRTSKSISTNLALLELYLS